ncbi:hypothetical protein L1987_46742 [Smallanthus sonchifolius]|uniref:Uncharacterized protein n=1 Tax=Smallanthus sonchifolius TaxID=185202 RepID=A0ACB9G1L2_9ASTR|nr:hypothetical protein L1987_46742 [Smallanthus sonchifolius]
MRINNCYSIKGYVSISAKTTLRVVDHQASILFGTSITVVPIDKDAIPRYYFNFASYAMLEKRFQDENILVTDFIGRVVDITEPPSKDKGRLLRVSLQEVGGKMIDVSLWQDIATSFDQEAATQGSDPVIFAATSLKV